METGSPKILEVMEKKTSLEQNINAARWTHEAGLHTIYQLVLGMPGENHQTISETIEFLKSVTEFLPKPPNRYLSMNYIQALPGTPVYEYARAKGFIGRCLEDEKKYLLSISDINAADDTKFLNFTEYDYFTVQSWRRRIGFETMAHYLRRWKMKKFDERRLPHDRNDYTRGGYFNLAQRHWFDPYHLYLYPLRTILIWLSLLKSEYHRLPRKEFGRRLWEWLRVRLRPLKKGIPNKSLRTIVKEISPVITSVSQRSMMPLREGR